MSQEVTPLPRRFRLSTNGIIRIAGLGLLALLLIQLDIGEIRDVLRDADWRLVVAAFFCVVPLIGIKTLRWQGILRAQAVDLAFWPALLAYFGSLFIGFLTPGRLGEFIKAIHVQRDCDVPLTQAFSTVLADRLFDLYALVAVGCAALMTLALDTSVLVVIAALLFVLIVPLVILLHDGMFVWLQQIGLKFGRLGYKLFGGEGLVTQIRTGLLYLTWSRISAAALLTVGAYGVFFGQCYLLAFALSLPVGFVPVMFAVALGSLVTLIPISISGLGTREAAMIAYLDTVGIAGEAAISFSLLVFVTFYIGGGVIGALAWWLKPVPLNQRNVTS